MKKAVVTEFLDALSLHLEDGLHPIFFSTKDIGKGFGSMFVYPQILEGEIYLGEPENNLYGCVMAIEVQKGKRASRESSNFAAGLCLMIDDVGTKVPWSFIEALEPTALIETSPGNHQAIYMFDKPVKEKLAFEGLIKSCIYKLKTDYGIADPGMAGVNRVFRLPGGYNTKPDYLLEDGSSPEVRLVRADYARRYHPVEIVMALQLPPPSVFEGSGDDWGFDLSDDEKSQRFADMLEMFDELGLIRRDHGDHYRVHCPWEHMHSGGDNSTTKLYKPSESNKGYGKFHCHHGSCKEHWYHDGIMNGLRHRLWEVRAQSLTHITYDLDAAKAVHDARAAEHKERVKMEVREWLNEQTAKAAACAIEPPEDIATIEIDEDFEFDTDELAEIGKSRTYLFDDEPQAYGAFQAVKITSAKRVKVEEKGQGESKGRLIQVRFASRAEGSEKTYFLQFLIAHPYSTYVARDRERLANLMAIAGVKGSNVSHLKNKKLEVKVNNGEIIGFHTDDYKEQSELEEESDVSVIGFDFSVSLCQYSVDYYEESWLIDGWMSNDEVNLIYGDSGAGKSFIAIDMAASIATGRPWAPMGQEGAGFDVNSRDVVYVASEAAKGIKRRWRAYTQAHEWARGARIALIDRALNLFEDEDCDTFISQAHAAGVKERAIFIDTLACSMSGAEENSAKDMSIVVANAKKIAKALASSIILVHHSGKNGDIRGSSAIKGAMTSMIKVTKMDAENKPSSDRRIINEKQKDGTDTGTLTFTLCTIPLGLNVKGKPISSCIPSYSAMSDNSNMDNVILNLDKQLKNEQKNKAETIANKVMESERSKIVRHIALIVAVDRIIGGDRAGLGVQDEKLYSVARSVYQELTGDAGHNTFRKSRIPALKQSCVAAGNLIQKPDEPWMISLSEQSLRVVELYNANCNDVPRMIDEVGALVGCIE